MDKITLKLRGTSGKVEIPPGDYAVAAAPENSAIVLAGHGKNYILTAINRRSPASSRAKKTSVSFYSMGGNQWTVVVIVPRRGEWVAFIQLDRKE